MAVETFPQRARRILTYTGVGLPRTAGEMKFGYLALILICAATIWGYVDVNTRGRIESGKEWTHRTDFTVYVEAGAAFFTPGRDPYQVMNARGWTYLYPPLFGLMMAPLSYFDTVSQVSIWLAISVVLAFGCHFEARRIWRSLKPEAAATDPRPFPWPRLVPLAALAVWLPGLDCMQRGQMGIALLYSLLLGYRLVVTARSWRGWTLGGFAMAWAMVVKLVPALPVAFLLYQLWLAYGKKASLTKAASVSLGVALGVFVFTFAIPAACVGWSSNLHYLSVWADKVAFNKDPGLASHSFTDSYTNQSLLNSSHLLVATFKGPVIEATQNLDPMVINRAIAKRRRDDWQTRTIVRGVLLVAAAMLAGAGLKSARNGSPLGSALVFGLSSLMITMVAPVAWGHYYVLTLPAVLFAPRWLWNRGRTRAAVWVAVWSAAAPTVHYAAMPWVGDLGLLGISTALWFMTVCTLYLRIADVPRLESAPRIGFRTDAAHRLSATDHEAGVTNASWDASIRP